MFPVLPVAISHRSVIVGIDYLIDAVTPEAVNQNSLFLAHLYASIQKSALQDNMLPDLPVAIVHRSVIANINRLIDAVTPEAVN